MKNKHMLWMILGCGLPLLLIFLVPSIGIGDGVTIFILFMIMFGVHFLMPMNHGNHTSNLSNEKLKETNDKEKKGSNHH